MTNSYNPSPRFGVFEIIEKTVRLFIANIATLFVFAFIPLLIFSLLSFFLMGSQVFDPNGGAANMAEMFTPGMFVLGITSVIVSTLVYALLIMVSYDAAIGDTSPLSQYISHGLKNVLQLVVLSLAFVVIFYIGALLFLLPGLYLMAVFIVFYQTVLIDGAGWKGLQASAVLTRGYRWPVLGAILLVVLISIAPFLILLILTGVGGFSAMGGVASVAISSALNALMYGFNAVFGTQVYLRLTELKRGGASGDLTDVFR